MIISLSSKNQPSNADFQNYMSDNFIIPPNASIALVNCSFTKPSPDGWFRVTNDNNSFFIKFNSYDISSKITIANGDYSLTALAVVIESACSGISPLYIIECNAEIGGGMGGEDVMRLKFLRYDIDQSDWSGYYAFSKEILKQTNNTKVNAYLPLEDSANDINTVPTENGLTGVPVDMFGQNFTTNKWTWGLSSHPTSTFTENLNSGQSNGFNCGRYMGSCQWTFCSANVNNNTYIGENKYDRATQVYNTKGFDTAMFRVQTDTANSTITASTRQPDGNWREGDEGVYGPGVTVRIRNVPENTVGHRPDEGGGFVPIMDYYTVPNSNVYYMPLDIKVGTPSTLGGWADFTTGSIVVEGNFNLAELDYNDWMGVDEESTMTESKWDADSSGLAIGSMGSLFGTGTTFRNTKFLCNIVGGYPLSGPVVGEEITTLPGEGHINFYRFNNDNTKFANTTIDLDYTSAWWTSNAGPSCPVHSVSPTLISVGFSPKDDAGLNEMTLWGSYSPFTNGWQPGLKFHVNATPVNTQEIIIQDFDGTFVNVLQNTLTNPFTGDAFPGFRYEGIYYIGVSTKGANGGGKLDIFVAEKTRYTVPPVITTYTTTAQMTYTGVGKIPQLPWIKFLGGAFPPNILPANNENRFAGSMFGFNVSQKNTNDPTVRLPNGQTFFTTFNTLVSNILGGQVWDSDALNVPKLTTGTGWSLNDNVLSIPLASNSREFGYTFDNPTNTANYASQGWFSIGNLNTPYLQEILSTKKLLSIAPAICFDPDETSQEIGVVNDPLENSLMKDLNLIESGADKQVIEMTDWITPWPSSFLSVVGTGEPSSSINTNDEVMNINLENLPHTTYNGFTHSQTKSIYQLPQNLNKTVSGGMELLDFVVPERVYIPLNNLGEFPINHLHIRIADGEDRTEENLGDNTHILIEIK